MHAVMGRAYTAAMASPLSSQPARGAPRSLTGLLPFLRPYRVHILLSGVFLVLAALATLAFPMALRGLWGNLHSCARKIPAPVPEGVLTTLARSDSLRPRRCP